MSAQLHQHDELGWLVDRMADTDHDADRRLCPKACARAKARLLREREMLRVAAERDGALCMTIDDMREAIVLARDALDRLMGDSDLDDDDSLEAVAMRAIARALASDADQPPEGE